MEAFKSATQVNQIKYASKFPQELAEADWWRELLAYITYMDLYGDVDQETIDQILKDK